MRDMHKDKNKSICLDKFNIVPQNLMGMLEWLRSIYSNGFEGEWVVAISAYRSLGTAQRDR